MFEPLEGGCLCGAVRYRISAPPIDSGYCHCRMCQKSSGGPVQASAEIPVAGFALIRGELKAYRSSAAAVRHFCPNCGSQITFRAAVDPTYISVNTPTLDRPEALAPRKHIWRESRIGWFEAEDDLPRYDREGPPVEG
jgi:hypothetical protein